MRQANCLVVRAVRACGWRACGVEFTEARIFLLCGEERRVAFLLATTGEALLGKTTSSMTGQDAFGSVGASLRVAEPDVRGRAGISLIRCLYSPVRSAPQGTSTGEWLVLAGTSPRAAWLRERRAALSLEGASRRRSSETRTRRCREYGEAGAEALLRHVFAEIHGDVDRMRVR